MEGDKNKWGFIVLLRNGRTSPRYELDVGKHTIGSAADCNIRLRNSNTSLMSTHAVITVNKLGVVSNCVFYCIKESGKKNSMQWHVCWQVTCIYVSWMISKVLVNQKPFESIVSNTHFIKSMFLKYLIYIYTCYKLFNGSYWNYNLVCFLWFSTGIVSGIGNIPNFL